MIDFDFSQSIDFDNCSFIDEKITVKSLLLKLQDKTKYFINYDSEQKQLHCLIQHLPKENEVYKMLSFSHGFSALSILLYITNFEKITDCYISTFRVGKKHFQKLCELKRSGKLENLVLITSNTQERIDRQQKYNYIVDIENQCKLNGFIVKFFDNHSKILLMKTEKNYYVIETSSNLNENPKIEQFSFENDKKLYEFYEHFFKSICELKEKRSKK